MYAPGTLRKSKRNGINYLLDISDYQNWLLYFGLQDDSPQGLLELVKPASVIFDVGANIGQTSMNMAKLAGPSSVIIGIEPDPVNFSKAVENLKLNTFTTINYLNIGLGARKEELFLKINSPLNRGGNRIAPHIGDDSFKISVEKLDDVATSLQLKKVDLIKIDVEGFELEVLKGSVETIKNFKPVLYIEVDDANLIQQGTSPKELFEFIENSGYRITDSQSKKPLSKNNNFANCHFDIICS
jgi:FkbM family methyltransferase